ncbi:MAG TPA: lysophospholipid acyltransferase family protein [Pyrinomonadaceae bacterium]|jgi:lysophospholipid acyltransferase (LPLAT)-like uncharacterized protein|nr:lysophospholipid acyltransferase family protein [Pyrinomonadaceae bacterium]
MIRQSRSGSPSADSQNSEKLSAIYSFADLSNYSFKERLLIRAADLAFYLLIRLLGATTKFEVEGWENHDAVTESGKLPIYVFWHERIMMTTYWWRNRKIVVLTSQSRDGEYIARFIQRFGYGAVRGSSTRGAVGAVLQMARLMRAGCTMCFVLDGPRGPRRVAKPGPALLAKRSGHPILPVTMALEKHWTLPTWDHFQVPRPFTRAKVFVAAPIYVAADADDEEMERKRCEVQRVLDELTERAEQWRARVSST